MTIWKYTNKDKTAVARTLEDGRCESCSVAAIDDWIAEGNTPDPFTPPPENSVQVWERIKTERDRLRFNGGVKVNDHWFLSTAIAAGEYNSLALISVGLPDQTVLRKEWRTMDGTTVDMTPLLVKQILTAGFAQIAAIDDAAQVHKALMEASANPESYDFSSGWPQGFEG